MILYLIENNNRYSIPNKGSKRRMDWTYDCSQTYTMQIFNIIEELTIIKFDIKDLFERKLIHEETTTMSLPLSNDWFYVEEGDKVGS